MNLFTLKSVSSSDFLTSETFDCHDAFGHGFFQRRLLLLSIITIFIGNSETAIMSVIAKDVDHWCRQPSGLNVSVASWKNRTIPVEADGRFSRCHVYKHPDDPNDTQVVTCDEWNYDDQRAEQTIVSVWNLVCERRLLLVFGLAIQFLGPIVLLLTTGPLSDWIGRAPVITAVIPILLIATLIGCVPTTYVFFTIVRFFASGSALCSLALCTIINFEVMAHQNRPLHVILCFAFAFVLADAWITIMGYIEMNWTLKQAIFVAPTLLSLPAVFVLPESPRWLIASGRLKAAEGVMLEAAKKNNFPLPFTASLLDRLSAQVDKNKERVGGEGEDMLEGCSVRQRALIMFGSYFSISFSLYVTIFSSASLREGILQMISSIVTILGFAGMFVVVTKFPLLKVLTGCFAALGAAQCALSVATALNPPAISNVLIVVIRPLVSIGMVVSIAYTLELFPTALRGTALCWTVVSGRIGTVCAFVMFGLQQVGREDVGFATAGTLLLASVVAFRRLPPATTVECAKIKASRPSALRNKAMGHMKRTLDQPLPERRFQGTESPATSTFSSRKSKRRRRKSSKSRKKSES
ncbi:solute carrier family 22 member 13-like [Haemaphysalis longicornis]